jgi:hypothetical protein
MNQMKFYVGDEVEVNNSGCQLVYGIVAGFYENGLPRIVNRNNGAVISISDYTYECPSRWAVTKPGPERLQVEKFFNQRSFWDRLCYLFTGKMP